MWKALLITVTFLEFNECKDIKEEDLDAAIAGLEAFTSDLLETQTSVITVEFDDLTSLIETSNSNNNAQFSVSSESITGLNDDLTTLSGVTNTIGDNVDTVKGNVIDIDTTVNTISGNINNIDDKIDTIDANIDDIQSTVNSIGTKSDEILTKTVNANTGIEDTQQLIQSVEQTLNNALTAINTLVTTINGKVDTINGNTDDVEPLSNDVKTMLTNFIAELNDRLTTLLEYTEQTADIKEAVTTGFSDLTTFVDDEVNNGFAQLEQNLLSELSASTSVVNTRHDDASSDLDTKYTDLDSDIADVSAKIDTRFDESGSVTGTSFTTATADRQTKYIAVDAYLQSIEDTLLSGIISIKQNTNTARDNVKYDIGLKLGSSAKSKGDVIDKPESDINNDGIMIKLNTSEMYIFGSIMIVFNLIFIGMAVGIILKCTGWSRINKYKPVKFDDSESDVNQ